MSILNKHIQLYCSHNEIVGIHFKLTTAELKSLSGLNQSTASIDSSRRTLNTCGLKTTKNHIDTNIYDIKWGIIENKSSVSTHWDKVQDKVKEILTLSKNNRAHKNDKFKISYITEVSKKNVFLSELKDFLENTSSAIEVIQKQGEKGNFLKLNNMENFTRLKSIRSFNKYGLTIPVEENGSYFTTTLKPVSKLLKTEKEKKDIIITLALESYNKSRQSKVKRS